MVRALPDDPVPVPELEVEVDVELLLELEPELEPELELDPELAPELELDPEVDSELELDRELDPELALVPDREVEPPLLPADAPLTQRPLEQLRPEGQADSGPQLRAPELNDSTQAPRSAVAAAKQWARESLIIYQTKAEVPTPATARIADAISTICQTPASLWAFETVEPKATWPGNWLAAPA